MVNTAPDKTERLAFQFCKIATFSLLFGRLALPVAAGLAAILFVVAFVRGVRQSQCFVRYPLAIAALWMTEVFVWLGAEFGVLHLPRWLQFLHPF